MRCEATEAKEAKCVLYEHVVDAIEHVNGEDGAKIVHTPAESEQIVVYSRASVRAKSSPHIP